MPKCIECNKEFNVALKDRKLLEVFDQPLPDVCSHHALQRRLALRNERFLYRRICEKCGKKILAIFSPKSYAHVYCRECWYSNDFDATQYGRDYNPGESFFSQWHELMKTVPHFNLVHDKQNTNCDYANYISNDKDVYLSFSTIESEGCVYCKNVEYSQDAVDCLHVYKSQLVYDCVDVSQLYKCAFVEKSKNCTECYFSRDLTDCQNCFGCVNLKHKQYYWFNKQLSTAEYTKRFALATSSRDNFETEKKKFEAFHKRLPIENLFIRNSEDATGNDIHGSKDIRFSFNINAGENFGDCLRVFSSKDMYRCNNTIHSEHEYEIASCPRTLNTIFSFSCPDSSFTAYSYSCFNSDSVFGCVNLRYKKYCILNKQYTKDEYEILKTRIIADMKKNNEWGQFFPIQYSPMAYNESVAFELFPLSKTQTLSRGWKWQDEHSGTTGKETLPPDQVPNSIIETQDTITQKILSCVACKHNYRIQPKELSLLKMLSIPVPLKCQDCRFHERDPKHPLPYLHHRQCMCMLNHTAHPNKHCSVEFETPYTEASGEQVFCKACYDTELLN